MRDRVIQLDGPRAGAEFAQRARDLDALSAHRGRIARVLDRERTNYAARARRTGDRAAAVAAVRAGEAQAAAEVLERNATVQAGIMRLMAAAELRGDQGVIPGLADQFNRLADQSEIIAPPGGRVGLAGLGGLGAEYVPPPPGAATITLVQPSTVDRIHTASGPIPFPPSVAAVLDPIQALNPRAAFFWKVAANGSLISATAVGKTPSGGTEPIRLPDGDAAIVRQKANDADFSARNLFTSGNSPYKLGPGGIWYTYNTMASTGRPAGTLRIFYPSDSPLEGLPEAISEAWDKVQSVAQAAANLACEVASNAVVQSAAMKLGPSATGAVASVNAYACTNASKPAPAAAPAASSGGGGVAAVGVLAALAALLVL